MEINNTEKIVKICNFIIKYAIFAAAFLMPIFFIPFVADAINSGKQIILLLLGFVALFAWMLKSAVAGEIELKKSKIYSFLLAFFLFAVLSTIFSQNRYFSFWGWPLPSAESLISVMMICIFFFLESNALSKKDTYSLTAISVFSLILCDFLAVLALIWPRVLLGFSNTVGSTGVFVALNAVFLPIMIVFLISSSKWLKILFSFGLFLATALFVITSYFFVWWIVLFGALVLMITGIFKKDLFDLRWSALPMFFLAISLFFLIANPQISWFKQKVGDEIFLSYQSSLKISSGALRQNPALGSGLGTFAYDFLRHKDKNLSSTPLWNVVFDGGASKVLTTLATMGILGTISFAIFFVCVAFIAGKHLFSKKDEDDEAHSIFVLGVFTSLISFILFYNLYNSNIVLDFFFFMLMAVAINFAVKEKGVYKLKSDSPLTLVSVIAFTIIFVFGISMITIGGQRLYAQAQYFSGLMDWRNGNAGSAIVKMQKAANANPESDVYFSQLSQAYLLKLQEDLANKKISDDDKAKESQVLVASAINASVRATDLNPKSANNWAIRGFVYQNLIGIFDDAQDWAERSYKEAISLDLFNPYLETQLGILYLQKKDYGAATSQLKKAVELNQNYLIATYYLGLTFDANKQKENAIAEFNKLLQIYPNAKDLQQIIANIKAGRPALSQQEEAPAPTPENQSPPVSKEKKK